MTTETQTEKKYPTHTVFFTTGKKDSDKKNWHRTGAAWMKEDKESMTVSLDIFGQKVSLVILKYKPREN